MLTHALNVHLADIRLPWLLSVNYAPRDSIRCSTVVIARLAPVGGILALLQLRVSNVTVECGPRWAMTAVWSAQPARERNLGTTSALSVNQDESRQVVLPFAKIAPSLLIHPGTLRAVSIARQEVFLKQARHRANSVQRVIDRTLNLQRVRNARRGGWQ